MNRKKDRSYTLLTLCFSRKQDYHFFMRLFFLGLVFLVYTGICAYMGARLFVLIRYFLPGIKALAFWLPFAVLCYVLVFAGFFRFGRLAFLRQAGVFWMAVFVYLFLSLVLIDIVRLPIRLFAKNIVTARFNAACVGAALCVCVLAIVYGTFHARSIRTVNYQINIPGQGSGLRIVLISDLHIGPTVDRAWVGRVVDTVNRAQPDMVCIAGDIFDGNLNIVDDLSAIAAELRRIQAPLGVFACLGNHDVDRISLVQGGGNERIAGILQEAGIALLQDEVRAVGENLYVAGRRDARPIGMSAARKSAVELSGDLDRGRTLIVLDHQPTQFASIEQAGAALVLCGHTHRGQLFPANLITRSMYKKAGGTHYGHWKGSTLQAVVTSGAGVWGPPLRISTNSEAAVIDISFIPAE